MRAGPGVTHGEYDHSDEEGVHSYRIWILPDEAVLEPAHEQRHFPLEERRNTLRLVASLGEGDGAAVSSESTFELAADGPAEILVFDRG